ncbi:unnamed protein product [Parnassius apollo]|uniref:(apollo) hypothetical protein n=1 Tax=Parnassius apollo TaxID=110799 RepID=A0A8S3XTK7_PARAO|nr:unnamed protein product [Parnassius apollo]
MKDKTQKSNGYQSDDDNVRYKLNTHYFNTANKSPSKVIKKQEIAENDDDSVRYKFPTVLPKTKTEKRSKTKPKIKVNFWSNKRTSRLRSNEAKILPTNHRHRDVIKPPASLSRKAKTSVVKVRKRVSFLPSPLFSDNHVPMVTVPDDLTIQLNEEEANDLREDLNLAYVNNSGASSNNPSEPVKRKVKTSSSHTSSKPNKRKCSPDNIETRTQGNENELEFFSKYVVQKLRRMETNQRIYSENLINTVLMLGQLGKLNGKSKIAEI